jgi:hypothetical protein
MTADDVPVQPSMLAEVGAEFEWGGAGRPAEIARRLGPQWTENGVTAVLAEMFRDGVVGHNHELRVWWVA